MEKAKNIRDEIITCFLEVQKDFIMEASCGKDERKFVISFLRKAFEETKGNYDNPTKESLYKAVEWLVNVSPAPNNTNDAQKHRGKIIDLINSL